MNSKPQTARTAPPQGRPTSKAPAQRARILAMLRERGPAGATNGELNEIGFRYGARIWELRRMGYVIRTVNEGEGAFRFILKAEPGEGRGQDSLRQNVSRQAGIRIRGEAPASGATPAPGPAESPRPAQAGLFS